MTKEHPLKCKLEKDGFFKWCNAMDKCLEDEANVPKKGLVQVNVHNFKNGKVKCVEVAYKKSWKNRGLMLNKCPWCDAYILSEIAGKLSKE